MNGIDTVNAGFELGGAVFLSRNVMALWRDRRLAGVSVLPTAWFNLWGAWNIYFYRELGQLLSWTAGFAVFAVNTIWIVMALWFTRGGR